MKGARRRRFNGSVESIAYAKNLHPRITGRWRKNEVQFSGDNQQIGPAVHRLVGAGIGAIPRYLEMIMDECTMRSGCVEVQSFGSMRVVAAGKTQAKHRQHRQQTGNGIQPPHLVYPIRPLKGSNIRNDLAEL